MASPRQTLLNMHNKTLIWRQIRGPWRPTRSLGAHYGQLRQRLPRMRCGGRCISARMRRSGRRGAVSASRLVELDREDRPDVRRPQARICPACHARQGRSRPVLRGGAEIRRRRPAGDLAPTGDLVTRAAAADRSRARTGRALDIVAPRGPRGRRAWSLWASARPRDLKAQDFVKLGGAAMGKIPARAERGDDHCRICPAGR